MSATMRTEDALRCMHRLMEAETLLDTGRLREADAIVTSVRTELVIVDEELTAPLSLAFMLLERVEGRMVALRESNGAGGESPILGPQEVSTCPRCGAAYDADRFAALALPANGVGVWELGPTTLTVRQCATPGCNDTLVRRIA